MVTHLIKSKNAHMTSCGHINTGSVVATMEKDDVTCKKCKRTYAYRGDTTRFQINIAEKIVTLLQSYPNMELSKQFIFRKCWGREYSVTDASTFWVSMHSARKLLRHGRIILVRRSLYKYVP